MKRALFLSFLLCLAWLCFTPQALRADTLTLKDGRTLKGSVRMESEDKVQFDQGGVLITIPRDRIHEILKENPIESLLHEARQMEKENRLEAALACFDAIYRSAPSCAEAAEGRERALTALIEEFHDFYSSHYDQGRFEQVLARIEERLPGFSRENPLREVAERTRIEVLLLFCRSLHDHLETERANAVLNRTILLQPEDPQACVSMCQILMDMDRHAEADGRPYLGIEVRQDQIGDPAGQAEWAERLVRIAKGLGKRIHVLHVTTEQEVAFLARHKDVASVEFTPQHLTLTAPEAYERLKGFAQMNPPIRGKAHQDALWRGIALGVADVLGSDHAPHTREEKARPYPASPSGMPGVQTLVPLMLTHVAEGRLTLERFVDMTSHGVNRVFGLADKGRMAVGYDADLTVVDLKARRTITHESMATRAGWTPFDGFEAKGWPMATIIRGKVVMRDDEIVLPSQGEAVRFQETLSS